jgi:hypothetical protein
MNCERRHQKLAKPLMTPQLVLLGCRSLLFRSHSAEPTRNSLDFNEKERHRCHVEHVDDAGARSSESCWNGRGR